MQNLISWLFTDPVTAGANTPSGKPETFHFYVPWIIFLSVTTLAYIYYQAEGRKRFFGSHALNKYQMDRFMKGLLPIWLVGWALLGARYAEMFLLSDRAWRYAWAIWVVIFGLYWLYHLAFRYAGDLNWYRHQRLKERYMPKPRGKKAARAGSR